MARIVTGKSLVRKSGDFPIFLSSGNHALMSGVLSRLVVVHYHLRPGGVRRVIELALPGIVRGSPDLHEVVLAVGEASDEAWIESLRRSLGDVSLRVFVEPTFRYIAEQRGSADSVRARLSAAIEPILHEVDAVWIHNPALGRNLMLADILASEASRRRIPVVFHHHDFWFENRWARWPEMRATGYPTLDAVARACFPARPEIIHAAINRLDHSVLRRHVGARAVWLPNPAFRADPPRPGRVRAARAWLTRRLDDAGPVWLCPTRLLRRKNLAEALLLTRWLRPEAWLVTTAAVSSEDERGYARRLMDAARKNGWRARFSVLADAGQDAPRVEELKAASEVVLLTSIQEGFGLPYVEAVAAGRPLLARRLPNVMPDLRRWGFQLPHTYAEVWIDPRCLDLSRERERQIALWRRWKSALPSSCRGLVELPPLVAQHAETGPVAFSHLTLAAQIEVLSRPAEETWNLCRRWNPLLRKWKPQAGSASLDVAAWPAAADTDLGVEAAAERFLHALGHTSGRTPPLTASGLTQRAFIEQRLGREFLFPLLMDHA
jgi:glycosyltransferase involved in cell wall biosynthesis